MSNFLEKMEKDYLELKEKIRNDLLWNYQT
jgi:hypothetical protein